MTAQGNNQKNQWINQHANYESYTGVHLKIGCNLFPPAVQFIFKYSHY